jgi:hypothetical protein
MTPTRRLPVLAVAVAAVALCAGVAYGDRPGVSKAMIFAWGEEFGGKIRAIDKEWPFSFVDPPCAYSVDNFGILMTSEISLATGYGPTMFGPVRPEQIKDHHHKVLERLPLLREQMKVALFDGAARFGPLDENERLAVAVTVYHFVWEDTTELPSQIVMQGTKKSLLEARTKTVEQGRDRAVLVKETY